MLFNSLLFLAFFPIVCILYWAMPHRYRNLFLLLASYYFYMSWEPSYALIIIFTTLSTWSCSLVIGKNSTRTKIALLTCLIINLLILFAFKYYNFAVDTLSAIFPSIDFPHSDLLLPVGISFYTFQSIGYIIDVHRKSIQAEKNLITYALFVSFFPQLVAGPIERAKNLLPQFKTKHVFNSDNFIDGIKMMIWGFFMKLCIAGNVAPYVDAVYNHVPQHHGTSLLLASFFFSFQIFCDFGGYSMIAIGVARCLDFKLMDNFRHPYLSTSVRDFWKRWHISLSSWFADYVYIPLGGSRTTPVRHYRNLMITMTLSGIWHGANWTFICWGALHGAMLVCYHLCKRFTFLSLPTLLNVILTYILTSFAWIFFRANSISDALTVIRKIFTDQGPLFIGDGIPALVLPLIMIALLLFKELKDEYGVRLSLMHHTSPWVSIPSCAFMVIIILLCAEFNSGQFIYFQF